MSQERCVAVDNYGYGEVKVGKTRYSVPNLLPGELAEIELFSSGRGKVKEILEASPERIQPKCPRYFDCGGCQMQHLSYERQLQLKTNAVFDALRSYGIDGKAVLPIIPSKNQFNYRNKNQMVISEKHKKVMSGFYEEFTHNIVNVDECVIQDDRANRIIKSIRFLLQEQRIPPYDEDKKTGLVRHVLVRTSESTGEILVVLVTKEEQFPGRNNLVKALRAKHPEITTIVQNVNPRTTSVVLGDFERILYGPGTIRDNLLGKTFLISSKTFYQINSKQTETIYRKALELSKPKKDDVMVDAYCGVGTIALVFSDHVKKVFGVDINKDSIRNAVLNSKLNRVNNSRFVHADAVEYMDELLENKSEVDLFLVDPPREGLDERFVKKLVELKPSKFVYISCNPVTMARDAAELLRNDYMIKQIQPIDMFPQTNHVESVTLFVKK